MHNEQMKETSTVQIMSITGSGWLVVGASWSLMSLSVN